MKCVGDDYDYQQHLHSMQVSVSFWILRYLINLVKQRNYFLAMKSSVASKAVIGQTGRSTSLTLLLIGYAGGGLGNTTSEEQHFFVGFRGSSSDYNNPV